MSGFAWAAAFVELLEAYSPLSWLMAGGLGALVFIWSVAGVAKASLWYQQRKFAVMKAGEIISGFNPLDRSFHSVRIRLSDFEPASPLVSIKDKTFIECDLRGPALIVFTGHLTLERNEVVNCEFVIVPDSGEIMNAMRFENACITGCTLFGVTVLVPESLAPIFEKDFGPQLLWTRQKL